MSKARELSDLLQGVDIDGDLSLGDNDKAIFGAGSDLQIYHDGTHSIIQESATANAGDLYIRGSNNLRLQTWDGVSTWQNAIILDDAGAAELYYDGTEKLTTTSTGVDVTGGATFTDTVTYSFTNGTLYIRNGNTANGTKITSKTAAGTANGYLAFEGNDKEYGRFDSSGQFGIGTNSPSSPLDVRYNGGLTWGMRVVNTGGGSAQQTAIRFLRSTTTSVVFISTTNTATQYVTSSDYRLKENAVDISDGITRLKQLQPKRFNFIADDSVTVDGFMAHEAQAVVPEAVTGTQDAVDEDGNPDYQGIDQSKLVPLLTAALQEAIAKIETLETKVAALETN